MSIQLPIANRDKPSMSRRRRFALAAVLTLLIAFTAWYFMARSGSLRHVSSTGSEAGSFGHGAWGKLPACRWRNEGSVRAKDAVKSLRILRAVKLDETFRKFGSPAMQPDRRHVTAPH